VNDSEVMARALGEAARAPIHGDVPVGAVLVLDGAVVASRHNERERTSDPLAHAEVLVLRDGARSVGRERLAGAALFTTLEPCVMCAGAILEARVARVVYGAADERAGGCGSRYDVLGDVRLGPGPVVVAGVMAEESAMLLRAFFAGQRSRVPGMNDAPGLR
jgi:tRNA(adenine34) deaminase